MPAFFIRGIDDSMQYVALEKLINLYDGYRQVFRVKTLEILLIQEDGRRYVIQANCPHSDWPMQNAPVTGEIITCTKHGWSFHLRSGRAANQRAAGCQLGCYKLMYEGNTIGIMLSDD